METKKLNVLNVIETAQGVYFLTLTEGGFRRAYRVHRVGKRALAELHVTAPTTTRPMELTIDAKARVRNWRLLVDS